MSPSHPVDHKPGGGARWAFHPGRRVPWRTWLDLEAMLHDLERLVSVESPSHDVDALSKSAEAVAQVILERDWRAGHDRRRPRRAARPLVGRRRAAGAGARAPRHRVPARHARAAAVPGRRWQGHWPRCVRHEGRDRAGDPRHRRARRSIRRGDAVHRRRGGRVRLVPRADRGAGGRVRQRARARAERRRRRGQDRPQGHRHVRGRRRAVAPRTPVWSRRRASTRSSRPPTRCSTIAALRGSRGRDDRDADGRPRRHRRQRRACRGTHPRRRPRHGRRRTAARRGVDARRCRRRRRTRRSRCAAASTARRCPSRRRPRCSRSAGAAVQACARRVSPSAAAATATSPPRSACRPSTASEQSAAAPTPTTSTCWSTRWKNEPPWLEANPPPPARLDVSSSVGSNSSIPPLVRVPTLR